MLSRHCRPEDRIAHRSLLPPGSRAGGSDDEICEALRLFRIEMGIAFQIIDDVLDLMGKTEVAGKSVDRISIWENSHFR